MMTAARPGVPYNVCSGRGIAIRTLVDTLTRQSRVAVEIVQDPALFRPNDILNMVGSHQRLTADTGWEPSITLEQTVEDLLAYWREHVAAEPAEAGKR